MIKAAYKEVVFIWTERSSSVLPVVIKRMNSPTNNGRSDPEELSKMIVGIPMRIRRRPRYFE